MYSSNLNPGNLLVNGPYVSRVQSQPAVVASNAPGTVAIVGAFTDGVPNTPQLISLASGNGPLYAAFGTGTTINASGVLAASRMAPEASLVLLSRVVDGTQTPAVGNITDGQATPGTVLVATALRPGSNANAATFRVDLQSGTAAAGPVYRITKSYPNKQAVVINNVVGSASSTSPYSKAIFQANALGMLNGTAPNSTPDADFVWSAGTSAIAPQTGVLFTCSGGTDGAAGITKQQLIGVDGGAGSRTGMYALRGQSFGGLVLAGLADASTASAIQSFLQNIGGLGYVSAPPGSYPSAIVTDKVTTNDCSFQRVVYCGFFESYYDSVSGQNLLIPPTYKIAAVIASLDPSEDPLNKPDTGAAITSNETVSQGFDLATDGATLEPNNVMFLTNQMAGSNGTWRLSIGTASDGSNILDTRMFDEIAQGVLAVLGRYTGKTQGPPPASGAVDTDPTREQCYADLVSFLDPYLTSSPPQLAAASVVSTLTLQDQIDGIMPWAVNCETLAGINFPIAAIQVGNNLNLTTNVTLPTS